MQNRAHAAAPLAAKFSLATTFRCCRCGLLAVLVLLNIVACSSVLKPRLKADLHAIKAGEYQLDPRHTTLLFKVDHMGFSLFVGRFNRVQASLNFDPEHIENAQLDARVDMASVDVNDGKFEASLRSRFWFNTEQYPEAAFTTLSAKRVNDNTVDFLGALTFMGITKNISLRVVFNGAATNLVSMQYTLGFSASSEIKRSDFGLDRFVPAIGDRVALEIYTEFVRE